MKVSILSPHFDDAAYGLTITISSLINQHVPVTIINCFTVTRWTAIAVEDKDVKAVSELRANEDAAFNDFFGNKIQLVNLNLLDAPLRNGYIFQSGSFAPNEWELVEHLSNYLQANVDGYLLCPLAIGSHIDHAICRAAVLRAYSKLKVIFYEDLPYAYRITPEQLCDHINSLEGDFGFEISNLTIPATPLTSIKVEAIKVYKSQLTADICNEIIGHLQTIGGERLWGEQYVIDKLKEDLF